MQLPVIVAERGRVARSFRSANVCSYAYIRVHPVGVGDAATPPPVLRSPPRAVALRKINRRRCDTRARASTRCENVVTVIYRSFAFGPWQPPSSWPAGHRGPRAVGRAVSQIPHDTRTHVSISVCMRSLCRFSVAAGVCALVAMANNQLGGSGRPTRQHLMKCCQPAQCAG